MSILEPSPATLAQDEAARAEPTTTRSILAERSWDVPASAVGGAGVLLVLLSLAASVAHGESAVVQGLALVASSAVVLLLPGIFATLLLRGTADVGLPELLGTGVALSFGVSELMVFLSLVAHVPDRPIGLGLCLVELALGAWLLARRPGTRVRATSADAVLGLLLAVVAALLYLRGSPFTSLEDQIHVSVIRRLASVPNPAINNVYVTPGFVYTYPFPGTHFAMATVSSISHLDPLFVYHKLRFLWGPAALLLTYCLTRLVSGSARLAYASAIAGSALVLNGAFAQVPGFYWGQLAPFSHASDLAMGVMLPGLLVFALSFLEASSARERAFFFGATLLLTLMLTIVHIREVAQFLVYLGSALGAVVLLHRQRAQLVRLLALIVAVVVIVEGYIRWQQATVVTVETLVQAKRIELLGLASHFSLAQWVAAPFSSTDFVQGQGANFYGGLPLLILCLPILLVLFRWRIAAVLIVASTLVYALIVRFPIFSVPYILATYDEILFTPVRNFVQFVYASAGIFLAVAAFALTRIASLPARLIASALVGAVVVVLWRFTSPVATQVPDLFWFGVPLACLAAAVVVWRGWGEAWSARLVTPAAGRSWIPAFAILLGFLAVGTIVPDSAIANVPASLPSAGTQRGVIQRAGCARQAVSSGDWTCFPDLAVTEWAKQSLRTNDVVLADIRNEALLTTMLGVQTVTWPGPPNPSTRHNFPAYFRFYDQTEQRYGAQPFFNTAQTLADRLTFARALGVTHVVVDPYNGPTMWPVLCQWPGSFVPVFDDGRWSVFQVRLPGAPPVSGAGVDAAAACARPRPPAAQ